MEVLMGTDNLFHKRKRALESFKRWQGKREPYDVILIVCEGSKSEPYYFKELCKEYRLSNTNIEIVHSKKTDPLSIVDYAIEMDKNKKYDRIYCVFDKDQHDNYLKAIEKIKSRKKMIAIASV